MSKKKSEKQAANTAIAALESAGSEDNSDQNSESLSLTKPFIQVGIFSVEQNARNTAEVMHQLKIKPTVKKQSSRDKTFWRVIVGPAATANERSTLLQKVKAVGFGDAYAVSK